jgi:hypothetical protein
MKALVVYESMYSNTRRIAEEIAEGLRLSFPTETALARDAVAVDLDDADLVVVGAPTHAWGLSRTSTRESAAQDAVKHPDRLLDSGQPGTGVREWLQELVPAAGRRAVAFDTRLDKPKVLTGSAARAIQRGLRHAGFTLIAKPESFVVSGMAGPLAPGETERANQWGEALGRTIARLTLDSATMEKSGR